MSSVKIKGFVICPHCSKKVKLDVPEDFVSSIRDEKGKFKPGEYRVLSLCPFCDQVLELSITPLEDSLQIRDFQKINLLSYSKIIKGKSDELPTYIDYGEEIERITWEEFRKSYFPTLKDFKKKKKEFLKEISKKLASLRSLKEELLEDKLLEDSNKISKFRNLLDAAQHYIYKFVLDNKDKFSYYWNSYKDEIEKHHEFYENFNNSIMSYYGVGIDEILNIPFVKKNLGFLKDLFDKDEKEAISKFEETFGVSYNKVREELISVIKSFYENYMNELKNYSDDPEKEFERYYGMSYQERIESIGNEISVFDVFLYHIQNVYFDDIEENKRKLDEHDKNIALLLNEKKKIDKNIKNLEEILKDPLKDPSLYKLHKRVLKTDPKLLKSEIEKLESKLLLKSTEIEKNIYNYIKENYGDYTIKDLISILEEKLSLLNKFDKCTDEEKKFLSNGPVQIKDASDKSYLKLQKHIYLLKSLKKWVSTRTSNIQIEFDSNLGKKIQKFVSRKCEMLGIKEYDKLTNQIMDLKETLSSLKKRKFNVYESFDHYYTLVSFENKIYLFFNKTQTSESINEAVYNLVKLCVKTYIETLNENIEIEIFGKPSEASFVKKLYSLIKKKYNQKIDEFIEFLNKNVKTYIKENPDINLKKLFDLMPELKSYKLIIPNDFFASELKSILKKKSVSREKLNYIYEKFLRFRDKYINIFKLAYYGFSGVMSAFIPPIVSKLINLKLEYDSYKLSYSSLSSQYDDLSQSIKEPDSTKVSMLTDILDTFESVFIGQGEKGFGEKGIDEMAFLTDPNCPYYYDNQYLSSDCVLGHKGEENPLWVGNPNWAYYGLDKFIPEYSKYLHDEKELHYLSEQLNEVSNNLTHSEQAINNTELMLGIFSAPAIALGAYYLAKKIYKYIKKKREGPVGYPSGRDLYIFSEINEKFK